MLHISGGALNLSKCLSRQLELCIRVTSSLFLFNDLLRVSQPVLVSKSMLSLGTCNLHYHYAFMELLELSSFDSSKRLDLSLL